MIESYQEHKRIRKWRYAAVSVLASFMVPHPPMIVPAVGLGSEKQIIRTTEAYTQVAREIAELQPETIIITSPHATMYRDYFHISPGSHATGSFSRFRAASVSFTEQYDTELVEAIESIAARKRFPAGTEGERDAKLDHGTMVPLWFIRQFYSDFRLVRIGLSGLPLTDHYKFGQIIHAAVKAVGRRAVLVASGDLSHKLQSYGPYGYAPEGPQYDERIMDVCSRAAFDELFDFSETFCDEAAECGHRSFVIMAGVWDGITLKASELSHEDITGVGYGICTFYPTGNDDSRRFLDDYNRKRENELLQKRSGGDPYVKLAWRSLESYILNRRKLPLPADLPEELINRRAGAFVSIHRNGRLRGCIGTIFPSADTLAEEIIQNAISASTRDPRFPPIRPDELKDLEINVDVLGKPEDIRSESELDVKRYGVIVTSGMKRGLLLPDLEGVDTPAEQISIARQKAGIRPDETITLQRFEVVRHT